MGDADSSAPGGTGITGAALTSRYVMAACLVATIAFWAYTSTLLPGVDLGDTGGFQAAVLWPETSARRAYPLYYFVAKPFVAAISRANPARGLNLFSAVAAALAVGLLVWITARLTRSAAAGAAGGLLLAFSFTFWTQAILAEVYALHLALVGACLISLLAFESRPTTRRLAVFFAVYALSFGNHLSMILLLVPFGMFLLQVHPDRRQLARAPTIALAVAIAGLGTLLYSGDFLSLWRSIHAPAAWSERIAAFWFDTTKADWRESMVLAVSASQTWDRLAMWIWDARQQFGVPGLAFAAVGWLRLWLISRPWGTLVTLAFLICTLFALTYNVGDTHVFFLPGHFLTALMAGVALAPARRAFSSPFRSGSALPGLRAAALAAVLLYAGWRGWETWPAVDRHGDRRAEAMIARMLQGLDDRTAILVEQMDWQSENALLYSSRYDRRTLAWARLADVLPHFPFLVRDNHDIGRDVVLTADAAAEVVAAFGSAFLVVPDDRVVPLSLVDLVDRLPGGTPYVLTLLTPPRDERFNGVEFDLALRRLATGRAPRRTDEGYEVWAGVSGEVPGFYRTGTRPFHFDLSLAGDRLRVRFDSWLPFDTFRRGGFGHVMRGREHVLAVERGASLVYFERDGSPIVFYAGGLYAPEPRFLIPAGATLGLAALPK